MSAMQFNLRFSSKPDNISKVEPFIQEVKRHYAINEELYFNMLLVLTEAVNNSIIHGNGSDPRKAVAVALNVNRQHFSFIVSDEGPGFDPRQLPDPTSPERICEPNGRGVFLMRQLSDGLYFRENGRKVEINFAVA